MQAASTTHNPAWTLAALAVTVGVLGCGAATPLLHPARVPPPGSVETSAGVASQLLAPDAQRILAGSVAESADAEIALRHATLSPGLTPWASLRLGLTQHNDMGLIATARALRVDARHVFEQGRLSLSAGAGVSALRAVLDAGEQETTARGAGVDVPLLVGWRSRADIVSVWAGVRGSLDWLPDVKLGSAVLSNVKRKALGAMLGLSIGVEPLWARLELSVDRAQFTAAAEEVGDVRAEAWSLSPATALCVRF